MDSVFLGTLFTTTASLITYFITARIKQKQFMQEKELAFYKVKNETMSVEREMLTAEETELRAMLREELDRCRIENARLDRELEELKRRLLNVEMELRAWELGLKVPKGFELIQVENTEEEDTDE
jgi:hypothetical protein